MKYPETVFPTDSSSVQFSQHTFSQTPTQLPASAPHALALGELEMGSLVCLYLFLRAGIAEDAVEYGGCGAAGGVFGGVVGFGSFLYLPHILHDIHFMVNRIHPSLF